MTLSPNINGSTDYNTSMKRHAGSLVTGKGTWGAAAAAATYKAEATAFGFAQYVCHSVSPR